MSIVTDKEKKQTPLYLSENELRKLSDKELDEHNSRIIEVIFGGKRLLLNQKL